MMTMLYSNIDQLMAQLHEVWQLKMVKLKDLVTAALFCPIVVAVVLALHYH